jgi:hypothetical protein
MAENPSSLSSSKADCQPERDISGKFQQAEKSHKGNRKQVNFIWRIQPLAQTPDGVLLSFIKEHPYRLAPDLLLHTLRIHWLALAYRKRGELNEDDLRQLGQESINALLAQVELIRQTLGLEIQLESGIRRGRNDSTGSSPISEKEPSLRNKHSNTANVAEDPISDSVEEVLTFQANKYNPALFGDDD